MLSLLKVIRFNFFFLLNIYVRFYFVGAAAAFCPHHAERDERKALFLFHALSGEFFDLYQRAATRKQLPKKYFGSRRSL